MYLLSLMDLTKQLSDLTNWLNNLLVVRVTIWAYVTMYQTTCL